MREQNGNREPKATASQWVWSIARPLLIVGISLAVVGSLAWTGWKYILDHYLLPVDSNDSTEIVIKVENGLGKSGIAQALYGEDESTRVIRSPLAFKVYVDFAGKANRLRAGNYALSKDMTIPEIVNKLASGNSSVQVVKQFTVTEGMTVEDIANVLVQNDIIDSKDDFLSICKSGDGFESVTQQLTNQSARKYALEGYLFPDTYKAYEGSSASSVIQLMVSRFNEIWTQEDLDRAEEQDMTVDQVLTLASMIEKEAKRADFAKVSAVFHNRLDEDMKLESDVTIKYALGIQKIYMNRDELNTPSLYNTHTQTGLPVGPICNPGMEAIRAALWPDEAYREEGYLFFTLMAPESGELAFSKTNEEHEALVAQYRDAWIAYDQDYANEQGVSASPSESPAVTESSSPAESETSSQTPEESESPTALPEE